MAKSKATFMKTQLEKKRQKRKQDKQERREDRKKNSTNGDLQNMMAYVNEEGEISSTPPPDKKNY